MIKRKGVFQGLKIKTAGMLVPAVVFSLIVFRLVE